VVFLVVFAAGFVVSALQRSPHGIIVGLVVGLVLAQSPKIAQQWERAVVLRLGKYRGLRGPGLFWIIPFVDSVTTWIDQRVITTNFNAEETLTSDTVPVNVDAVLFWMVYDPEKAALEVQNYALAVSWAAQTALRDVIGRTSLTELLRGRERIEADLQKLIDERCTPWGSPCSRSRCATSSSRRRCRMRCPAKRKPPARNRHVSSSARPRWRLPTCSRRRQRRIMIIPPRSTSGR